MDVQFVSVAGGHHDTFNPAVEATETLREGRYHRVSFGGRTKLGRSGVTVNLITNRITGHKIEPIPPVLPDRVRHFGLENPLVGLKAFSHGEDVLIGTPEHGILLTWTGPGFEVFGSGADSYVQH